jgi:hypothetical protein
VGVKYYISNVYLTIKVVRIHVDVRWKSTGPGGQSTCPDGRISRILVLVYVIPFQVDIIPVQVDVVFVRVDV